MTVRLSEDWHTLDIKPSHVKDYFCLSREPVICHEGEARCQHYKMIQVIGLPSPQVWWIHFNLNRQAAHRNAAMWWES